MAAVGRNPTGTRGTAPDYRPPTEIGGRTLARWLLVVVLGGVTSIALFYVMQALITAPGELQEAGKKLAIEFVRLRRDTAPEEKEREKPTRQKPEQAPPPPEMNMARDINPSDAVGEIIPMLDTSVELAEATNIGAGGADSSAVPLVRIDPEYPERAKQQRIEGWVEIEYTITPVGTVADVRVVRAKPPVVFDRAAVEAARRWKFNPMMREGVAVARPGNRYLFTFTLPKGSR